MNCLPYQFKRNDEYWMLPLLIRLSLRLFTPRQAQMKTGCTLPVARPLPSLLQRQHLCYHLHPPRCSLSDSTLPRTGRSSKDNPQSSAGRPGSSTVHPTLSSLPCIHQISHEVMACATYTCTSPPLHSPALCALPRAQLCHPGAMSTSGAAQDLHLFPSFS